MLVFLLASKEKGFAASSLLLSNTVQQSPVWPQALPLGKPKGRWWGEALWVVLESLRGQCSSEASRADDRGQWLLRASVLACMFDFICYLIIIYF